MEPRSNKAHVGIIHYTAPPVIGGVEAVMLAQAQYLTRHGYAVTVVAGQGESSALPGGASLILLPKLDSQDAQVLEINTSLERGELPDRFDPLVAELVHSLQPVVAGLDHLIVHNVYSKHFNLALTAALQQLIEGGAIQHLIAWCHDFSWTSASSRAKVHPGYPWDLLRSAHPGITYVTVSARRQEALAGLFGCPAEQIQLIYNGVDPTTLLGLSPQGIELAERLDLLVSDLTLLMPVRVTRAKNIEYALQVLAALKRSLKPKLIVTGPPDPHDPANMQYYQSLQGLRRSLGIEDEALFIYESGPEANTPFFIDERLVGDLYRLSDIMFMPSHREGFGMPVLEAGLAGIPVVCTDIPAAREIGGAQVTIFAAEKSPEDLAALILELVDTNPLSRFRRSVRQSYTWEALFQRQLEPLLNR
jgi:glycosyltransferase involved in cell wall biosynthesis